MTDHSHYWIRSIAHHDRTEPIAALPPTPTLASADAHRRLRGPYTAAGTLLRAVVPAAVDRWPELAAVHGTEIVAAAPELSACIEHRPPLMTSEPSIGRTQFHPAARTMSIANGLAQFFHDYALALDTGPLSLVVDNVHEADPTDHEFLAVLLRRLDPAVLTVVTASTDLPEPDAPATAALLAALEATAQVVEGNSGTPDARGDDPEAYVERDGTGDAPASYHRLSADRRAALHDARAAELAAAGEFPASLGALAFHREHGGDPAGAGLDTLVEAADHCVRMGFYDAALDLARRARVIADRNGRSEVWEAVNAWICASLIMLDRFDEADALLTEIKDREVSAPARISAHRTAAAIAANHPASRDLGRARDLLVQAMAEADQLPDDRRRALVQAQNQLGLALIEAGTDPREALRLLETGLLTLDETFGRDEHMLQRLVMRMQQAEVRSRLGDHEQAIADYTAAIAIDPNEPRAYFERAVLHQHLGHPAEALADYDQAARLGPPYPEVFYNRGNIRADLGDLDGALADFGHAVMLDPSMVDAYVNRAGILCDMGEGAHARRDVDEGLALAPSDPHLLCLRGRLLAEDDDIPAAKAALSASVEAAPGLAEAWATRGALAYQAGDLDAALSDLDRAVGLDDDPAIRFNRALARQRHGRHAAAIEDFDRLLGTSDDPEARYQRGVCHLRLGHQEEAQQDFLSCLVASPAHADQVRDHMGDLTT
ncbi:tetratricopeptide repeat protein [Actinomadura sp. 3N407]|uniref:tetratricopeptide repeat protein n=1 Tax=Actinomadura sp. 3N407 TaxID=3457423 RepID=UPI003FCD1C75